MNFLPTGSYQVGVPLHVIASGRYVAHIWPPPLYVLVVLQPVAVQVYSVCACTSRVHAHASSSSSARAGAPPRRAARETPCAQHVPSCAVAAPAWLGERSSGNAAAAARTGRAAAAAAAGAARGRIASCDTCSAGRLAVRACRWHATRMRTRHACICMCLHLHLHVPPPESHLTRRGASM
jgi:hypothetical protein